MNQATIDKHKHLLTLPAGSTPEQYLAASAQYTNNCAKDDGYALIRKGGGTRCHVTGVTGSIDCDKVADRATHFMYDLVISAGAANQRAKNANEMAPEGDPNPLLCSPEDFVEPAPYDGTVPQPGPTPPPVKVSREQFAKDFSALNDFYAAPEGLQRVGGMVAGVDASVFETMRKIVSGEVDDLLIIKNAAAQVLNVVCDEAAMIQWGYDLMSGVPLSQIIESIKQSGEYKAKHP